MTLRLGNELSAVDPTAVAIGFHHSAKLTSGMDGPWTLTKCMKKKKHV